MTPSGIEPETFRFVAQHLNHCATASIMERYYNKQAVPKQKFPMAVFKNYTHFLWPHSLEHNKFYTYGNLCKGER